MNVSYAMVRLSYVLSGVAVCFHHPPPIPASTTLFCLASLTDAPPGQLLAIPCFTSKRQSYERSSPERRAAADWLPPVCCISRARYARSRGERPTSMSEELARDELGRDRSAIDDHERPARHRRSVMEGTPDELLADAGLTRHEHRDERALESRERREEASHPDRGTDHSAVERLGVRFARAERLEVGVERDLYRSEMDARAWSERHRLHPLPEIERAVPAPEIADADPLGYERELHVRPRDVLVVDHDLRSRPVADDARAGLEPIRGWGCRRSEDADDRPERSHEGRCSRDGDRLVCARLGIA